MSRMTKTPVLSGFSVAGAVVALVGLVMCVTDSHRPLGIWTMVVGAIVEVGGFWIHDRQHMRRGEPTHALWGYRGEYVDDERDPFSRHD
jgi:hypothetical protein